MIHGGIFSIPVSRQRQTSMKRRFAVFSSVLFLLIFCLGSAAFAILMKSFLRQNAESELRRTVEISRLKLANFVNCEIALAMKMAGSPLIRRYMADPADAGLRRLAFEEIAEYRKAFENKNVFWISDRDKKYYFGDKYIYTLDPARESSAWYNELMDNPVSRQLKVNFDVGIQKTMLWIDALVFDRGPRPVGIVGTGLTLTDFVEGVYENHQDPAELYIFNAAGEITGAADLGLVENKVNLAEALGQPGSEILAAAKEFSGTGAIDCFETKDRERLIAVASIPALDWYMAAVRSFTKESLRTGLTALFGVIMAVILFCFAAFNLFVAGMLEPLNGLVKTVRQALSDWELKAPGERRPTDEIGTLGDFLKMTIIDPLTGVYNRRYMDGHLKKVIGSLGRAGGQLSLLMVDIDYFKTYNDNYGHDAGDGCLKAVADALVQCLRREDDFIARYGGDEFAVVMPNTDRFEAQWMANKLLTKVRKARIPNEKSDVADHVTVSIGGVTATVNSSARGGDYLKLADKALFESKKSGRNRCTFEYLESEDEISFKQGI
jgi:methyl-accepting chemotaxis protein